jgi:hypothetical protein
VGCQSHDVRRPLSAFVDLVPKLLALPGALGCSPESMQFLRRLVAHDPDESKNGEQLEQTTISYDVAGRAFLDVLDNVSSETCILLQIEDAQWLDQQSARLVEETCNWARSKRVLLLLTSRSADHRYETTSIMAVRPLSYEARLAVANALAKSGIAERDRFVTWCVSSSGGNPYYLIELLREGTQQEGVYRASASITRLLTNRVRLLESDTRALLEACCVLAQRSTMARIELCLEMPRMTMLRALDQLDGSGMIELDGSRILCKHDLLSSVVFSQMGRAAKGMLHRFVAAQLETEFATTQEVSLMWESAEHWLLAADTPRAIQLLRRCGTHLMDVGMPEEAERVLERAESVAQTPLERYRIGTERARAMIRGERHEEVHRVLEDLLTIRNSLEPKPSELDEVGTMHLQTRWQNGDSLPEIVRDCLNPLSSNNTTPQEAISAAGFLLTAADNLCDSDLAERIYARVSNRPPSDEIAIDTRLSFQMIYNCSFGDASLSRELADELASYARLRCPPMVALRHLRFASQVHRFHGAAESTLAIIQEAFALGQKLGARQTMSFCCNTIASVFLQLGDYTSAGLWLDRSTSIRPLGYQTVLDNNTWSYRAELVIRLGDFESAQGFFDRFGTAVMRSRSPRSFARMYALQAQMAALQGEKLNQQTLQLFLEVFNITKLATGQDFNVESLCIALNAAGESEKARLLLRDYLETHRRDLFAVSPNLHALALELSNANDQHV